MRPHGPAELARAKSIFLEASTIESAAERRRFVAESVAGDAALGRLVEELLEADQGPPGVLDGPADELIAAAAFDGAPPADGTGTGGPVRLGRFRITGLLGVGGMGRVHEAVDPHGRRVAVKLLDTSAGVESMARFRREVAVLRRLDHPGIARVIDAGVHDDGLGGRPWYAMELVAGGRSIDAWARAERPGRRDLVRAIIAVCDAVSHAHDRGVIHRDLTPGNVLVGDDGRPRVIDFGVARLREEDGSSADDPFRTRAGQVLGTLASIPPEQLAAGPDGPPPPADVRGDVYAIGLMLFELLVERPPWPFDAVPPYEIPRLVREEPPLRPSSIDRSLRGDLETILLTAIEVDPARRYPSPARLADDLRRWLDGEAIVARRDRALSSMHRQARRHRLALGLGGLLLACVLAVAGVLLQRLEEARQRTLELEREEARAALTLAADALDDGNPAAAARALRSAGPERDGWTGRHLARRVREALALPRLELGGGIRFAVASPDGGRLALVDDLAGSLRVVDARTGALVPSPMSFESLRDVRDVHWSPDGEALVVAREGGGPLVHPFPVDGRFRGIPMLPALELTDTRRLEQLRMVEGGGLVAIFSDGTVLGSHLDGGTWDRSFPGQTPLQAAVSPDGRRLAIAGDEGMLAMLDPVTGRDRWRTPAAFRLAPSTMEFDPAGTVLLTAGREGHLDAWDVEDGRRRRIADAERGIDRIAASPTGRLIACAVGRAIRIRDATSGAVKASFSAGPQAVLALAFGEDGTHLRSLHADGGLREWDLTAERAIGLVADGPPVAADAFAWSPDGRWLAVTRRDGRLELRDGTCGSMAATLELPGLRMRGLTFDDSGDRLAALVADGATRHPMVWRVPGLASLLDPPPDASPDGRGPGPGPGPRPGPGPGPGDESPAAGGDGIAWVPGSDWLLVAGRAGHLLAVDATSGRRIVLHAAGAGPFGASRVHDVLALDADSGRVVAATPDGGVLVGRIEVGGGSGRGDAATGAARDPASAAAHASAAAAGPAAGPGPPGPAPRDHPAPLRLAETSRLDGHRATVRVARFTRVEPAPGDAASASAGTVGRLATGDAAGTVMVWDLDEGAVRHTIRSPRRDPVTGIAWLPGSRRLAFTTFDAPAVIHDLEAGRRLLTLPGSGRRIEWDGARGRLASLDAVHPAWIRIYATD